MTQWILEPGHTAASFIARHMMVTKVRGKFGDVHGSMQFDSENPTNGSTVGYLMPNWAAGEHFVETRIVHGGSQAMPLFYDNTGTATYSEAERTFAVGQDWTEAGVATLVLYFHGDPDNTGRLYVKINDFKVFYNGDAGDMQERQWMRWSVDLASLPVNLQNIMNL